MLLRLWKEHDYESLVKYICCPKCGRSTGLPETGFHMVIPEGGLKCVGCGEVVIQGNKISY